MTTNLYVRLQHCNKKNHVTFTSHIFPFNVPNRPTFRRNAMRKYIRHMSHISQDFSYTKHITRSEARTAVASLFMKAAMYQTILNFIVMMSIFSQPMLKYTRVHVRLQAYTE